MKALVASEWIKTRALRSTGWTPLVAALVVAGAAAVDRTAFPVMGYVVVMVLATGSGAAAIVGEYASGLLRTTTVAVPARGRVIVAKAVVVGAVWTVAGAVVAAVGLAVAHDFAPGSDGDLAVAFAGATLLCPVCALVGLGVGVLVRHGIATTVTGVIALALLPQMFSTRVRWTAELHHAMVFSAWQRLTLSYGSPDAVGRLYPPFVESWLAYVGWPAVALGLALVVVRRRDV